MVLRPELAIISSFTTMAVNGLIYGISKYNAGSDGGFLGRTAD